MAAPVEKFFSLNRDVKSVAIICADNTWGRTYLDVWKAVADRHNVVVVDENCISEYSTDMRTEILRAKAKRPDALIVAFGIDRALKRMQEIHFTPKVLTTSDLDEAIHSRGFPASEAEGVYFADWLPTESFRARFQARFNDLPIMAPQNSYEALRTLAEAFRKNDRDLQHAIQTLNYSGDTGPVDYRGTRAGNRANSTLLVVANGKNSPSRGNRVNGQVVAICQRHFRFISQKALKEVNPGRRTMGWPLKPSLFKAISAVLTFPACRINIPRYLLVRATRESGAARRL